jgi:putative ABC transport system permease protein
VFAARLDLLETVSGTIAAGTWLNEATAQYPTVVLGARAATRLGFSRNLIGQPIWLGGRWFTVVGILAPVSLVPALDLCALIGWPAGERYLDFEGDITTLYVRAEPDSVDAVRGLLARTANPEAPNEVDVARPSDALAAEAAADVAFTGLLLGLGAVALLVGGIGVANTMVISVLERRAEIGLRRSQGATRGHIRIQFFGEALLLALLGGGSGILIGWLVTAIYAHLQGWPVDIPLWVPAGGMGATLVIGGLAGLYPAIRAARLAPTEALSAA